MRTFSLMSSLLLITLGLTGCSGKSHEAIVEDIASNLEEMNSILAGVNDAASAKAAAPRLKRLADHWQGLQAQLEGMSDPDEVTMKRIKAVYDERIAFQMIEMREHVMRFGRQPGTMDELAHAAPFTGW